MKRLLLVPLY